MNKLFITLLLLFLSDIALGKEIFVLELDSLDIKYRKHVNYRDSYFPEYETIDNECTKSTECMKFGANALFNINVIRINNYNLFWRNDIMMDSTNKQVRHVGWDYEVGLPLVPDKIEMYYHHESRHILEQANHARFPLRDEYVINFNIYKRDK